MHTNPANPSGAPTEAGARTFKINILFVENVGAAGSEVPIRYATTDLESDNGFFAWDELDPLESGLASAWNTADS